MSTYDAAARFCCKSHKKAGRPPNGLHFPGAMDGQRVHRLLPPLPAPHWLPTNHISTLPARPFVAHRLHGIHVQITGPQASQQTSWAKRTVFTGFQPTTFIQICVLHIDCMLRKSKGWTIPDLASHQPFGLLVRERGSAARCSMVVDHDVQQKLAPLRGSSQSVI